MRASKAERGETYRKAWRGVEEVVDAEAQRFLRLLLRRRGVPARMLAQGLVGVVRARGGEETRVRGGRRTSPAPLFIRGGVVTGAVTTPPGSPAAQQRCGLCMAAQMLV